MDRQGPPNWSGYQLTRCLNRFILQKRHDDIRPSRQEARAMRYLPSSCTYCVFLRVSAKERRKPRSGKDQNKACKACFVCKSMFCSSCRICSKCCSKSTCGRSSERLLENMCLSRCNPKSSVHTEKWLQPSFQGKTASNQNPISQKCICKSLPEQIPAGGFAFAFGKMSHRNGRGSILSDFLQLSLLSSQADQQVAPNLRLQLSKQISKGTNLQNGNSRVYNAVTANRRVGLLSRFQ